MIDRVGQRFGKLLVIRFARTLPKWIKLWECQCDCGNTLIVRANNLVNGTTKSCGCLKMAVLLERSTKHGLSGGHGNYTRLYSLWLDMRDRCFRKTNKSYSYYGGRGITVCKKWDDYASFHSWAMANGYKNDLTIERIDTNGNYEPNNCKWATRKEQGRNKRNNRIITINGETKTLIEWTEIFGIPYGVVRQRIHRGMAEYNALTLPLRKIHLY